MIRKLRCPLGTSATAQHWLLPSRLSALRLRGVLKLGICNDPGNLSGTPRKVLFGAEECAIETEQVADATAAAADDADWVTEAASNIAECADISAYNMHRAHGACCEHLSQHI
jgi:hypothetical protein